MDKLAERVEAVRSDKEAADKQTVVDCITHLESLVLNSTGGVLDTTDTITDCLEDIYVHLDYLFAALYRLLEGPEHDQRDQITRLWRLLAATSFMSSLPHVDKQLTDPSLFEACKGPRKGVFVLGQCLGCLLAEQEQQQLILEVVDPATSIVAVALNVASKRPDDGVVAKALPMALPWIIDILNSPFAIVSDNTLSIAIRSVLRDVLFRVLLRYEQVDTIDTIITAIALCHEGSAEMCDSLWVSEELRELTLWLIKSIIVDDASGQLYSLTRLLPLLTALSSSSIGAQQVADLLTRIPVLVADRTADRRHVLEQVNTGASTGVNTDVILLLLQVKEGEELVVSVCDGLEMVLPAGTTGSQRGDHHRVKWNIQYSGFELMYRQVPTFLPLLHRLVVEQRQDIPTPQVCPLFATSKVDDLPVLFAVCARSCLDSPDGADPHVLTLLLEALGSLDTTTMDDFDLMSETSRGLLSLLDRVDPSNNAMRRFMVAVIRLSWFERVIGKAEGWFEYDDLVAALAYSLGTYTGGTTPIVPRQFVERVCGLLDRIECVLACERLMQTPDAQQVVSLCDINQLTLYLPQTAKLLSLVIKHSPTVLTPPQFKRILDTRSTTVLDSFTVALVGQLEAVGLLGAAVDCVLEANRRSVFLVTVCRYFYSTAPSDSNIVTRISEYFKRQELSMERYEALVLLGKLELTRDTVGRMLDDYPQLCVLVDPVEFGDLILERPACLDHINPIDVKCDNVTSNMIPTIIKCPQLLDRMHKESRVYRELIPLLPERLVQLCTLIPVDGTQTQADGNLAQVVQSLGLVPLFFTRPNLTHPKLAGCLSKHKDLLMLLVVEMGLLEAVASVDTSFLHLLLLDILLSAEYTLPQVALQRIAVILSSTRASSEEWLAAAVRLCDLAAGMDMVMMVMRLCVGAGISAGTGINTGIGAGVGSSERQRVLLASLHRSLNAGCNGDITIDTRYH